jgi:PAS domain S-box-containing protein
MVLRKEIALQIKDLLKENPQGLSITDIVKEVNINRNTAGRYLENLLISGQVEMRRLGMAKIYVLSQRVPLSAVLSISSELVMQMDSSLRIIFANEPFHKLIGTDGKSLVGKNIEYTPVALVFDDFFPGFLENIRKGLIGKEWAGEIVLTTKDLIFFCRIAPTVFDDGRKGVSVILEDITGEKRAELTLRESEDRYRKLVEISPDAVFLHREGKIIYANPAAFKLLGASHSDEIIGENILDFIHPDFLDAVRKNIEKDLRGNITPPIELHMLGIDGASIIVEGRGVKTTIDGKPAVQVAIRDITERKRGEEALRESEGKLNAMLQSVPDIMSMMDKDLTIMWANEPAKRYFGKDIIGKKCYEAYHLRPDPCEPCLTLKTFLDGKTHQHETTVIDSQGEERLFECKATVALRDNSGNPAAVLEISRDITEKKKAEDQLRESEEKYRTLINQANDVISIVQDGVIKMCNPRLAEFWGGSIEEVLGKPFTDFVHPEALPEVIDRYNRRMAGESPPSLYETVFMRKDGSKSYVELNAGMISYKGKNADLVIVRDINERKRVEAALRESEQAFKRLLEQEFDAIAIHKEGKITFLNNRAVEILGAAKPEDLIGRSIFDFIHPDSRKVLEDRVRKLGIAEGMPAPLITEKFIRTDGTTVTIEVMAIRFDDNGIPAYRVAFREIPSQ